jgi:gamma-glutamylcyclotransferase (GGCT)/AIG2-like uncharacterized protein YtfP
MSSTPLLVYGTLRLGYPNRWAKRLARSARHLGTARVPGRLYRVTWYPGLRLRGAMGYRQADDWVTGDLFHLRNPATLADLDAYEGKHEYRRVIATAMFPKGEKVRCWVYEYRGRVNEARRIVSGDWMEVVSDLLA